jgi:hypothetical protein
MNLIKSLARRERRSNDRRSTRGFRPDFQGLETRVVLSSVSPIGPGSTAPIYSAPSFPTRP